MKLLCTFVILIFALVSAKPLEEDATKAKCGYESCHPVSSSSLNVHLVAHSHDDVGWLKTVDQYYYGDAHKYQFAGVQYIIGSVVQSLLANPDRKFIQVESAFFWQWWKQQSESTKKTVRQLVDEGRLEFINGAWSMNDEAAAHYHSIIDQFTHGLKMINDTLGECARPKIGWQIDPFGHSSEMASIFTQLGYEAMFFARLDYRDSEKRHTTKTLETMWQGSQSLGAKSNLFTGVLYDFYTTPAYFCWDVLCSDVPINDDPESPDNNQKAIVDKFADYVTKGASYFSTNNILITMGGDFTYQAAEMFYANMDRLIAGFKKYRPSINVIYSTPSCYLKAVNVASAKLSWPLKTDDFFPYASGNHSYWTGYFTSRPNSKRFERQGNNMLQVTKQLTVLNKSSQEDLVLLKEAMGVMQHHDAITGTEKQHVVNDYVRLMTKAMKRAEGHIDSAIHGLLGKTSPAPEISYESCLLSNMSYCRTSTEDEFTIAVYNPLSRNVTHFVHLPVAGSKFNITGAKGNLTYSIMPSITNFTTTHNVTSAPNNLIFRAELPALGFAYFHIKKLPALKSEEPKKSDISKSVDALQYFGTKKTGVQLDTTTGRLVSVTMNNITLPVTQDFLYYRGTNGTNYGEEKRASGAYIFRPVTNTTALPIAKNVKITLTKETAGVVEVHQEFATWAKQIIRIYENESYVEFDWLIGPLQNAPEGVEVITRFTTNLASNATFHTDSNGREMIKRVRNYRETYTYTNEEPVSGNYYPVTARIAIMDSKKNVEVALLNDRAQGGSSLKDGELELMLHRRLLNDDAFGVGEALKEDEFGHGVIVRGQTYLVIGNITKTNHTAASISRDVAQRKLLAPWTFVGHRTKAITLTELKTKLEFQRSFLKRELPVNIQILTLEPWVENKTFLLRLEHVFAKDEHPTLSKPTTVSIDGLFTNISIKQAFETTLGANQWIEENKKLQWNVNNRDVVTESEEVETPKGEAFSKNGQNRVAVDLKNITLGPMEIRTFICHLA